jgi:hypothetical protein
MPRHVRVQLFKKEFETLAKAWMTIRALLMRYQGVGSSEGMKNEWVRFVSRTATLHDAQYASKVARDSD